MKDYLLKMELYGSIKEGVMQIWVDIYLMDAWWW